MSPDVHFPEPLFEALAFNATGLPDNVVEKKGEHSTRTELVTEAPVSPDKSVYDKPPVRMTKEQVRRLQAASAAFYQSKEQEASVTAYVKSFVEDRVASFKEYAVDVLARAAKTFEETDRKATDSFLDFVYDLWAFFQKAAFLVRFFKRTYALFTTFHDLMFQEGYTVDDIFRDPQARVTATRIGKEQVTRYVEATFYDLTSLFTRLLIGQAAKTLIKLVVRCIKRWAVKKLAQQLLALALDTSVVGSLAGLIVHGVSLAVGVLEFVGLCQKILDDASDAAVSAGLWMIQNGFTSQGVDDKLSVADLVGDTDKSSPAFVGVTGRVLPTLYGFDLEHEEGRRQAKAYRRQNNFARIREHLAVTNRHARSLTTEQRFRYPSLTNYKLWILSFKRLLEVLKHAYLGNPDGLFGYKKQAIFLSELRQGMATVNPDVCWWIDGTRRRIIDKPLFRLKDEYLTAHDLPASVARLNVLSRVDDILDAALDRKRGLNRKKAALTQTREKRFDAERTFLSEKEQRAAIREAAKDDNERRELMDAWMATHQSSSPQGKRVEVTSYLEKADGSEAKTVFEMNDDRAVGNYDVLADWQRYGTKVVVKGFAEGEVCLTDRRLWQDRYAPLWERAKREWTQGKKNYVDHDVLPMWPLRGFVFLPALTAY